MNTFVGGIALSSDIAAKLQELRLVEDLLITRYKATLRRLQQYIDQKEFGSQEFLERIAEYRSSLAETAQEQDRIRNERQTILTAWLATQEQAVQRRTTAIKKAATRLMPLG